MLKPWLWLIAATALLLLLRALTAHAHEGDDPVAVWYRSLQTPQGASCCNMTDCHPVEARLAEGHWQVRIGDTWREVPDKAVLKRENRAGEPVVCIWHGEIRCFVPAGET